MISFDLPKAKYYDYVKLSLCTYNKKDFYHVIYHKEYKDYITKYT